MALPWVRLDSSIASHDKILALLSDPSPKKWQAAASYMFALGWSGQQGTDGRIPVSALPFVHATPTTARLLVKYGLWTERTGAYDIPNYAERQQLNLITEMKQVTAKLNAKRAACARWHGPNCHCWREGEAQ